MTDVKSLITRLDLTARAAMERAAASCASRSQASVDVEHLVLALMADPEIERVVAEFDVAPERVRDQLTKTIDAMSSVRAGTPALSTPLIETLKEAWSQTAFNNQSAKVPAQILFLAALTADTPRRLVLSAAPLLAKPPLEALSKALWASAHLSPNQAEGDTGTTPSPDDPLHDYTTDLTALARAGKIDPVIGRDGEIRQIVSILLRRRQNNAMLAGEAGVGKTAVVEGLANLIAQNQIPQGLKNVRLLSLDLAALQAGASMRGEFEERLRTVINAVSASERPTVVFIDEAHMLLGAGGTQGQGDAANLLKPALARGAFRCIGATTWAEYKSHIDKDSALRRRFEVVKINEPEPDQAVTMLRGLASKLEHHHKVKILDQALVEAVRLAQRYMSGRRLPDSAISVLDTACAKVAVSQQEPPVEIVDARARIQALEVEQHRLEGEQTPFDPDRSDRLDTLEQERIDALERIETIEARWQMEQETVAKLLELEADGADPDQLRSTALKLDALHEGSEPLVRPHVDADAVAQVVSGQTGVPTGQMLRSGAQDAQDLLKRLSERIVAQDGALQVLTRRVSTFFAQLAEPGKPTGVFLLTGPSGVGKTETAHVLADALFGGRSALVTINMSEYQEAHSISGLRGAPPGYVGYGRGGILTEAVRRRPYSVLLLDEFEKAHRDVVELFYQIFDKGMIEDSEGVLVDFSNAMVILTSNLGDQAIAAHVANGRTDPEELSEAVRPELRRAFPPAFLGRLTVVPYLPLEASQLAKIATMKLQRLSDRVAAAHNVALSWDSAIVEQIVARATETESGARNIEAVITDTFAPQIADILLQCMADGTALHSLHASLDGLGGFYFEQR